MLLCQILGGLRVEVVDLLKRHLTEVKSRFGVRRIGLFGSYARGEQRRGSDVDIIVEFKEPTFDNFMDLVFFLENLLGREVDLVTPNSLSPHIRPVVEREVIWCE